jgi:ribonuclease HI
MSAGSPDRVTVYTDGALSPARETGGWGAVIRYDDQPVEINDGEVEASNALCMEITAAIEALNKVTELVGPAAVHLVTDSENPAAWAHLPDVEAQGET